MEEWKIIPNYPDYKISNQGRILNIKKNKFLTIFKHNRYYKVKLSKNGQSKQFRVHRLVAEAFIPNPDNFPFVNHKDENPENNFAENLEWCSSQYNNTYGTRIDKAKIKQTIPIEQYDKNMNLIASYESVNDAGKACNIKPCNISNCLNGRQKTAGTFIWKYKF